MIILQMALSADAAGHRVMDPSNALGDDYGGGSRAGFLGLVRAMGRLGKYKVRAVGPFNQRRQVIDGVEFHRLDQAHKLDHPDVIHSYYDGQPLHGSGARLRIWGHHTYVPMGNSWDWADVCTAPGEHSLGELRKLHPHGEWEIVPNAVEGLDGIVRRPVPGRVIYHTSPDRGLFELFGMWPEIRQRVPHATLHVVGDVGEQETYQGPARSVRGRRAAALRDNRELAEASGGVRLLGRLTRAELLRELSEASCFAFPASVSGPCETWSISVHECCEIGLPVVLAPVDALEMWRPYVSMMPGPISHHRDAFVEGVVNMLTVERVARETSAAGLRVRDMWSFDKSAVALDGIIHPRLSSIGKAA